ncbi:MAG: carboxymuconolactone decarboxylase family protein [Acidobacteriota bacterium]|nr:carboxymuconolactone decarboxylase family protein [Acidobacteriota bacterium]
MKTETIKPQTDDQPDGADVESPTPRKPPSYSMVDPRMMRIYLEFYRETYSAQHACLDRRTQELIAIAASLAAKCQGCLEGHIKKALKEGATKDEIAESIAIAMGVNAAAVVDLTDIAAARLDLEDLR